MTMSKQDVKKVFTGLLIAMGGAGLTYLTEIIPAIDYGELTPVVVALWAVFVNIIRKYLTSK